MTDKNYTYTPLAEPTPISEQVWPEGTIPLVATSTLTYNHEPYIRDCLDGILMQKTTFPVRVVVFEDCSTDATRDIVKEYQEKYPNLFVTVFAPHNTYGKPERREALKPYFEARAVAKYIALCEGDDYWIDPLKLQKQVDFLEGNSEYSMCFHNAIRIYQDIEKPSEFFNDIWKSKSIDLDELISSWIVPTASMIFRSNILPVPSWSSKIYSGDMTLYLHAYSKGKIYALKDIMSVYRISFKSDSISSKLKKVENTFVDEEHVKVFHYYNKSTNYKFDNILSLEIKKRRKKIKAIRYKEKSVLLLCFMMPIYVLRKFVSKLKNLSW